jgi:RNA polymerase sigma factor (sigma-70 family)
VNTEKFEIEPKIIEGCKNHKIKYQELLYKQFYGYGMSICLRYSYNKDEAVEILNDSFLKVFENIEKYKPELSFKSWLRRIIINTSIDYYRKSIKFKDTDSLDEKYDAENNDYNIIDELNVEDILKLLNQLPEIYRLTFNLYEIEGFKHEEIAEQLNISISTSRSNLTRAKKMLRNSFEKLYQTSYARVI